MGGVYAALVALSAGRCGPKQGMADNKARGQGGVNADQIMKPTGEVAFQPCLADKTVAAAAHSGIFWFDDW